MPRPAPYLPAKAGELVTAELWNELQVRTREELASGLRGHEASSHASDPQNPTVRGLSADTVRAGAIQGDTVRGASMSADALAASTATLGAATVKTLKVTGGLDVSGVTGAMSPRVYSAAYRGGVTLSFASNLSVSSYAPPSQYFGQYFATSGQLCNWAGVEPQIALTLESAGLVQLRASWLSHGSTGGWGAAQFIIGSGGKYSPVRFDNTGVNTCGAWGNNAWTFSPTVRVPTAATFQTFLDYNWSSYTANGYRWPLTGIPFGTSSNGVVSHQDAIEVPAGKYTIQMGFSGNSSVANLQLTATFYPGGTSR